MNNILSLKTVGLSYASTNLSFAFALYFNISMFLLYHNPPLFSITRRTCPNVFLFGVQIPVDACPLFGSKRRSFLFVIDKKQPQPRLFLYTGESVRFDKNAHCFAVEPSGWRFVPRVNSLSSLFRRFAPSDSPPPGTPVALSNDNATVIFAFRQVGLLRSYILFCKVKFSQGKYNITFCQRLKISLWRKPKFHRQRRFHSL